MAKNSRDGYEAPYVNAFYHGKQITEIIESFKYTFSEKDEDNAEFNVRSDNRLLSEQHAFQEGAVWTVIWGYIGGPKSHIRTVVCYETKWEYTDQNVLVTISFHEKGLSLKQRASKQMHQDTNLVNILHDAGKVHGLTTSVEIIDAKGNPLKVLTTDGLKASLEAFAKQQREKQEQEVTLFGNTNASLISNSTGGDIGIPIPITIRDTNGKLIPSIGQIPIATDATLSGPTGVQQELAFRELIRNFAFYPTVAQGNKTDKQLMDDLGNRQPGGQYIVDTTDEEAVLRKRNFNQKPIRSWKWAGDDGDLLKFTPENKGAHKHGSSINMQYDGWDRNNKTYFAGDTNVLSEAARKTLAKYQKQYDDLKDKVETTVIGHIAFTREAGLKADATNRVIIIPTAVTILDKKTALKNTIEYFTNPTGNNKAINDPTTNTPTDAFNNAQNLRQEAELKTNPGTFEAIGDPTIQKGQVVTITGVGKKYSGNYYITKVEHSIDGFKHYDIKADVVRQGHNIKTNTSYVSNTQSGKDLNKIIGTSTAASKTKIPSITGNP